MRWYESAALRVVNRAYHGFTLLSPRKAIHTLAPCSVIVSIFQVSSWAYFRGLSGRYNIYIPCTFIMKKP
jgi:hypothetical protein